jgi:hypothetical protein
MATILGTVTLDEVDVIEVDSDPSAGGGTIAARGSLALDKSGFQWSKFSASDTGWLKLSTSAFNEDLILCDNNFDTLYDQDGNVLLGV